MTENTSPQEVQQAIQALYYHPDVSVKKQADKWLQLFQKTTAAWSICVDLLQNSKELEVQFFSSSTLESLKKQEIESLIVNISSLLEQKYGSSSHAVVNKTLSLAFAALVIRTDAHSLSQLIESLFIKTKNAITYLLSHDKEILNTNSNSSSAIAASISTIGLSLDILGNLCDGLEISIFSFKKTEEINKQLKSYSERILSLSAFALEYFKETTIVHAMNTVNIVHIVQSAYSCILKWIKFGIPFVYLWTCSSSYYSGTNSEEKRKLIELIFEGVKKSEYTAQSIDILIEIAQKPSFFTSSKSLLSNSVAFAQDDKNGIMKDLINRSISLGSTFQQAILEKREEVARGISQLIVALAEANIKMITDGTKEGIQLVEFTIACFSLPDKRIAGLCLDFWSLLEGNLDDHPNKNQFIVVFQKILEIIIHQVRYPQGFKNWQNVSEEIDEEDFNTFREDAQGVLLSCFFIIGNSSFLGTLANAWKKSNEWENYESILFCLRSVSKTMIESNQESNMNLEILSQLIQNTIQLPVHPILSQSVARLLGDYCLWISKEAIHLLGPSLQLILQFLNLAVSSSNSDLAFNACLFIYSLLSHLSASALNDICKYSGKTVVSGISTLLSSCNLIIPSLHEVDDRIRIVESVHYVAHHLPPQEFVVVLHQLVLPIVSRIRSSISLEYSADNLKILQLEVKVLSSALRVPDKQISNIALDDIWNLLKSIMGMKYIADTEMMENICETYIEVFSLDNRIAVQKEALIILVTVFTLQFPFPQIIKVIGSALENKNDSKSIQDLEFASMFQKLSEKMFVTLQQGSPNQIELVENYFYLLKKMITTPSTVEFLLPNPVFFTAFQLAVASLQLQERDALKAVLDFLETLIQTCTNKSPQYSIFLQKALEMYGLNLIISFFKSISNTTQCRPLIQSDLLFLLAQTQLMQNWILTALGTEGVATNLSPQEKSKFLSLLCTKIVKDKRKFKSLLNDFSQVCNHQLASDVFLSYEL